PTRASRTRLSMQIRNAASVLPEPVGADISTSRPDRISGHPSSCGSVVRPKRVVNHSEVRGSKPDSTVSYFSEIPPRTEEFKKSLRLGGLCVRSQNHFDPSPTR